jgi:hypothetical protein
MLFGLFILILFSMVIIFLRKKTQESNNSVLKTAMKVGDFFIWVRFLSFIIILMLFLLFAFSKSK